MVPIPKPGKVGRCEALRLIHLLDPISKAWHGGFWDNKSIAETPQEFGFVPLRSRIEPITLVNCVWWNLVTQKSGALLSSFDVRNAFPSIHRDQLDLAVRDVHDVADHALLIVRHRSICCFLQAAPDEACAIEPGSGDLQGDSGLPRKFVRAYREVIAPVVDDTATVADGMRLTYTEPITGEVVDLSHAEFADDHIRLAPCFSAEGARHRLQDFDQSLQRHGEPRGVSQNFSKRQWMARLAGAGSVRETQFLDALGAAGQLPGGRSTAVKYLGALLTVNGTADREVQARISAA
jgi:hypothetical protein